MGRQFNYVDIMTLLHVAIRVSFDPRPSYAVINPRRLLRDFEPENDGVVLLSEGLVATV